MNYRKETEAEQLARLRPYLGSRILAGTITIPEKNFKFEVWAYRGLDQAELNRHFRTWRSKQARNARLPGQTIRVLSNAGRNLR